MADREEDLEGAEPVAGSPADKVLQYRRLARDCEREARTTPSLLERHQWRLLAQHWRELASDVEVAQRRPSTAEGLRPWRNAAPRNPTDR